MRTVEIDGQELELEGSTLTLLHFEQEFDEDMLPKIAELAQAAQSFDKLGKELQKGNFGVLKGFKSMTILRIAWALNKTANDRVPAFKQWLEKHNPDPFNRELLETTILEAQEGCFRQRRDNAEISRVGGEPKGRPESGNDDNQ